MMYFYIFSYSWLTQGCLWFGPQEQVHLQQGSVHGRQAARHTGNHPGQIHS